jgi:predicted acylesterase/phospholipase RssA
LTDNKSPYRQIRLSNSERNKTDPEFSANDTVQVLSLNGGGLKGLYTASVIKSIEDCLGHPIADHFDIVAGTSTGGLIALGLGLQKSGKELQQFYLKNGKAIFPSTGLSGWLRLAKWPFLTKYAQKKLRTTLQELYSDSTSEQPLLGHSTSRLLIPTYVASQSLPRVLKTPHAARYTYDPHMPMWAVGLATSAAPTYFPAFKYDKETYIDGGVWANNPSILGVVEALDLGASLPNIRVLNIGTTYEPFESVYWRLNWPNVAIKRSGLASWATKILPLVMEANSFSTSDMYIHQLLSTGNSAVINDFVEKGKCSLDKVDMKLLVELGEKAGANAFSEYSDFFTHQAAGYTPKIEVKNGS